MKMLHPYPQPRILTAWEIAAITAQCIRVRYPDDVTPHLLGGGNGNT